MNQLLVTELLINNRNSLDYENLQKQITELFLSVDEDLIIEFLQSIEDSSQEYQSSSDSNQTPFRFLVQRLRLCLHPDKNSHQRAGEAFARMTFTT